MENQQNFDAENKGLVTITEEHGNAVAMFSTNAAAFYSSFKADTFEDKAKLMNAMANPTYKLDEVQAGFILLAKDIVAHKVQLADQATGEVIDGDRIVIVLENGETVAGVSKGFKGGITNLMNIFGQPTWSPALPILIRSVKTRSGNNTYNLNVVLDSPLPKLGAVEEKKSK